MFRDFLFASLGMACVAGCSDSSQLTKPAPQPKKSVIAQSTQDIGKYDADAGWKLSDSKIEYSNPITGGLEAYGPAVEQVTKMAMDQNLALYNAEHGRYPNYDEFMSQIVKRYNLRLKVLPGGEEVHVRRRESPAGRRRANGRRRMKGRPGDLGNRMNSVGNR